MNEITNQPLILKKKSRSSRFSGWSYEANSFKDRFFRGLYIFLLFAMDFIMFIYSINGRIYEDGKINMAVVAILGTVFVFSLLIMFCLAFFRGMQNFVCALCTLMFTAMFFYQFGVGNVDGFLDDWFKKNASWLSFICVLPTPWLVGLIFGMFIFFFFQFSDVILFITLVLLFSCGIGIQKNEFIKPSNTEHEEIKWLPENVGETRENNVIYMMLPKFPSYLFLNDIKDPNFKELKDLLIGFYATNQFEIYPNAFVYRADTMSNIIDILNQVDYSSSTSAKRGYASFVNDWNFIHGGLDVLSLEENRLYKFLHQNGFGVSTYAMPEFNFCLTGGDFLTDRCVIKGYKTVSLYDNNASLRENIYSLMGEWILSLKSYDFKDLAKTMIDRSALKDMKVLSENRRTSIEGSDKIFEKLSADFKRDIDGQFYLVYVDLPSDIYVYDEFCNIKPREDWVALKDNTLYWGGIDEKRKAYVDQAKCLIGKLQEYMDNIKSNEKIARTDIYIQGVSPIRELAGVLSDQYSRFVSDRLVNLAVRRGKNPHFLINANVCLASDFTKSFMYYKNYCYSLDNLQGLTQSDAMILKKNLINNSVIRDSKLPNIVGNYLDWYEMYKTYSKSFQEKSRLLKQEQRIKEQREKLQKKNDNKAEVFDNSMFESENQANDNIFVPYDDFDLDVQRDSQRREVKTIVPEVVEPIIPEPVASKTKPVKAKQEEKPVTKPEPMKAKQEEKNVSKPEPVKLNQEEKSVTKQEDDEVEMDFF